MPCVIDHLVITAPSLATGAAFIRRTLGVSPQPGGQHLKMSTHNLLLRLGDTAYLEVIAPDPAAPAPKRPRWFALDGLATDVHPALATWVARTSDIASTAAASAEPLGSVETMSRGALEWLITIPPDGAMPLNGVCPALIQWRSPDHPPGRLPDQGLSLIRLDLYHPEPNRVIRLLQSIDIHGPISVLPTASGGTPRLDALIATPRGLQVLPGDRPEG
ncbi:MAG: VOC family protein [Methylococcaceae bacterium]|nr:VOC family protein [Methylococcaceae bacterium]